MTGSHFRMKTYALFPLWVGMLAAISSDFHTPASTRDVTPSKIEASLRPSQSVKFWNANPKNETTSGGCRCPNQPSFSRVITLANEFNIRSASAPPDVSFFFEKGMGFTRETFFQKQEDALKYLKKTFGIPDWYIVKPDFSSSGMDTPNNRLLSMVFVIPGKFRVVADSADATHGCAAKPTQTAMIGGPQLYGLNATLFQRSPRPYKLPADSAVTLFVYYIVFGIGTDDVRRFELRATKPYICHSRGSMCGIIGNFTSLDDGSTGKAEGLAYAEGDVLRTRITLSWPDHRRGSAQL